MKAELKSNSVNQVMKETDIYEQGEAIHSLALVVKGRICLHTEGMKLNVGSGYFLGLLDLNHKVHNVTYTAETDAVVYVFPSSGTIADVSALQGIKKDYGMLMAAGLGRNIRDIEKYYRQLGKLTGETRLLLSKSYQKCREEARNYGVDTGEVPGIEKLQPGEYPELPGEEELAYYAACAKAPREAQAAWFGSSSDITTYFVRNQLDLIQRLQSICTVYLSELQEMMKILILNRKNLFRFMAELAGTLQRMGEPNDAVLSELDKIIDKINRIEILLSEEAGIEVAIDREYMEDTYFHLLNPVSGMAGTTATVDAADDTIALVEENFGVSFEPEGILERLMEYAGMDEDESQRLTALLEEFERLPDKLSTEDSVRRLRREISKLYYPMYEKIFLRDYESDEPSGPEVDLFLRYGLLSEKLVTADIIEQLCRIDNSQSGSSFCHVYDMKEWLTAILSGEKEPSKNEFDMNYDEYLRDLKKRGSITAAAMSEMQRDTRKKLQFEIDNMFRNNHRLVNGQITVFVPFLYTEGINSSLDSSFLSKDKINGALNRIRQLDYSAFYRPILFKSENPVFQKEYIQEEVGPDIIVFPGSGTRGIMWQELSNPRRNSSARFLFPSFFEGDLERMVIQVTGSFRWELCRTMQGVYWNNIQIKSLTSEYSDFLQFYRKNRELSEERKEKLKLQIQKHRNNSREVFASDYEIWIRHESRGGMMLSKPVREIMATYCPFNRKLREELANQPLFRDASARFQRELAKKCREYDLKFRAWEKDGVSIPEEIRETRKYYDEY